MLGKVNDSAVIESMNTSIYGGGGHNVFINKEYFPQELKFVAGNTYKLRIMPPDTDPFFKDKGVQDQFALSVPQHYGIGHNGKEAVWCPAKIAPHLRVTCPLCEEFANTPNGSHPDRCKCKNYYYMLAVLLSQHNDGGKQPRPIPIRKPNGQFMVYLVKINKKEGFNPIAKYYNNRDRSVVDITDLKYGCTVTFEIEKTKIDGRNMTQCTTTVLEASRGDLTSKIQGTDLPLVDINDIKDLRFLTEKLPSTQALREMMEGVPVADAISQYGSVSIFDKPAAITTTPSRNQTITLSNNTELPPPPPLTIPEVQIVDSLDLPAPPDIEEQPL